MNEVAAGGQATVYRARDVELGRTVALKVLHPQVTGDPQYLERFMREARMASSLSHPNIATIYEVGHDAGSHFIAMEYLPESLREFLRDEGPLRWRRALEIIRQIASGLQAAHGSDVIHRDLKPQNVLRSTNNGWKVSDFGIARSTEFAPITQAGAVLGSPQYMSPEQARGDPVDKRTDLFSVGVVLYELLTGRTPLDGRTPRQVLRHHVDRRPLPLQELVDLGVPDRVVRIVRRLTEPASSARCADAETLITEVDAALGGEGGESMQERHEDRSDAESAGNRPRPSRLLRLWAAVATVLAAGALVALVLFLFEVIQVPDGDPPTPTATPTQLESVMPDPQLRTAVGEAVGKPPEDITEQDLATLSKLEAPGMGISNLSGLEHATSLATLRLDKNGISNLTPLAGLKSLRELSLNENQIRDLSSLSGLAGLHRLKLDKNQVTNLNPLSGLTSLKELSLTENRVSDLGPLAVLTELETLRVQGNEVSDLAPIAGLFRLKWLDVASNEVSDIGPVARLTRLVGLWFWDNNVSDLSPVAGLGKLEHLDFRWNRVSELAPIGGLTSLKFLDMGGNRVSDLSPLSDLTRLEALYFWGNQVKDLTPVAGLIRLKEMDFDRNQVSDLAPLSELTALVRLYARDNAIRDLAPLRGLSELRTLLLDANLVTDIGPLSALTKLGQDPPLSDERDGVTIHLGLKDNRIADCRPLVDNPGLGQGDGIDLRGNPLNTECTDTHRPALEKRGVRVLDGAA